MKVRIGYGLGVQGLRDDAGFGDLVDGLEGRGFDSLWLSERLTGDAPDPMVGLAFAAGRTRKLKLGTSVQVLPGRNPAVVAKEWASLDRLSGGRTLPAFGLGVANPAEQQAFGVARDERAAWFDEALPLVRRLWTEDDVDHDGPRFSYRALSVRPKPVQQPPDVWLGGRAKSELRRVGRLGDGWLPSFSTPGEVAAGRVVVEEAAADAGREIEDEHYGALVIYVRDEIPELLAAGIKARRPDVDPGELVPVGFASLRARLEQFLEHGFSKLVLVPAHNPGSWAAELDDAAREILPLQTWPARSMASMVSKWVVLRDHVVDADDVDADGHVLDEILARWVDEACAAYLDQCRVLGEMRDREGLVLRSRVGSWPPGARLGRPTSVAVSAGAREVRRSSFTIAVRLRTSGGETDVTVNVASVVSLQDPVTRDARELGDDVRDELIALEQAAAHFN